MEQSILKLILSLYSTKLFFNQNLMYNLFQNFQENPKKKNKNKCFLLSSTKKNSTEHVML